MTVIWLLIALGLTALICPVSMSSDNRKIDIPVTLTVTTYTRQKERIDRLEGALMLMIFGAYYTYLFIKL